VSTKSVIDGHTIQRLDTVPEEHVRGTGRTADRLRRRRRVGELHASLGRDEGHWISGVAFAAGVARGEASPARGRGCRRPRRHRTAHPRPTRESAAPRRPVERCSCTAEQRRQGLGEGLLRAAEDAARARGKSLLVLDTASADAERLYVKLGWQRCGVIPGYALLPRGGLCDTTLLLPGGWIPRHSAAKIGS